jgi:Cu-Zn family superoxide dismutase
MPRALILLFLCACAAASKPGASAANPAAAASAISGAGGPAATAVIEARSGSALTGSATFTAVEGANLGAHVEVQNAAPGLHGVHVHEKGDCSDPKAASAGGHYNPNAGAHHGGPATPVRHGGDLGNITIDASGKGALDVVVPDLSLNNVADGVSGRAIVVHEKADDLQTDPAGNSGARIGCGVIQAPPVN